MAKVLDYDGLDHVVDKIYDLVNSGGSADYIIEQGKNGGWYYRKWASGVLEAWINSSQSVAMTTNINGQYYGNTTISISQFGFIETPNAVVTGKGSGAYFATKIDSSSATEIVLSSRASNTATTTVVFNISLRGLWKTLTPSVSAKAQIGLENLTSQMASGTNSWELRQNVLSHCHRFGNLVFISAYGVMTGTVTNGMTLSFCKIPVKVRTLLTGGCSVGGVSYPLIEMKDYNGVQYLHEDITSNINSGTTVCFWAVCAI